jgi:hypothetical protein
MGLDTSHDCWHGAYSAFMRWRTKIAEVAGLPPLCLMEGFWAKGAPGDPIKDYAEKWPDGAQTVYDSLPIAWDALRPDPALYFLLSHSDCDGEIPHEICAPLAERLSELLPAMPAGDAGGHIGGWREKTQSFIDGLKRAAEAGEPVDFH